MRKLILLSTLALFCASLSAQVSAQISPQIVGAGAPSNPCANGGQQYVDQTNKLLYGCPVGGGNWANLGIGNVQSSGTVLIATTIGSLSAYAQFGAGVVVPVKDGASASDCTSGSGSTPVTCQYNGSSWAALGGSGGSGTVASCGTTNSLAIYTAATTTGCGNHDFTYATHTLTGGASAIVVGPDVATWTSGGLTGLAAESAATNTSTGQTKAAGFTDTSIGYLATAMTAQSTATPTPVTNMAWNIAASKNYLLKCDLPINLSASATLSIDLNGPGTPTSYTLTEDGGLGAAGAYKFIQAAAAAAWATATGASGTPGIATIVHVSAAIQNGATASGTQLQLRTIGNGTNSFTVGANSVCVLTQVN